MKPRTILEPDWSVAFGKAPEVELRFVEEQADSLYLLGITYSDIRVGDTFRSIFKYPPQALAGAETRTRLAGVVLRVKTITSFHNKLNRIPADMTVGLEVVGQYDDLFLLLSEDCWHYSNGQFHQWPDAVEAASKLTLAR